MRANEFITEDETPVLKLRQPSERAKAWIEKVYELYPGTFQNNHVMVWGEGDDQQFAMFELVPSMSRRDAVEVKWFQAYPLRQGVGSRGMKELQRLAQEDGIALTLFPWDKGQVSQAKLMKFYKGHGFKPVAKGSKSMEWMPQEDLEEEILDEGATSVLYHYTSVNSAYNILQSGEFNLSSVTGSVAEKQYAPEGYDYFFSTTRTKVGDYHRWAGSSAAMFVLDGNWFGQRYPVKPIDYWDRAWIHSPDRSREAEDRVFSKEPSIPIGGVREIHILMKEQSDYRSPLARKLMILAKKQGIPTFLYKDVTAWKLQDTRKAVSPGEASDVLRGQEQSRVTRPPLDYLSPWLELIYKNKKSDLSPKAEKLRYIVTYYGGDANLGTEMSNARKPGNDGYDIAVKINEYMRKNGFKTTQDVATAMREKWKNIKS